MNVLSKNINQLSKDKFLDFLAIETNIMPDKLRDENNFGEIIVQLSPR